VPCAFVVHPVEQRKTGAVQALESEKMRSLTLHFIDSEKRLVAQAHPKRALS
jgi:hypothetical protein